MGIRPYQIVKTGEVTYTFNSIGTKGTIKKLVQFSATSQNGIFNVGFGDIQPNGEIDDKSESNNGDIAKVLVTIISIIFDYTHAHRDLKIVFTGSTSQRTFLYQRLLSRYYSIYSIDFTITGLVMVSDLDYFEEIFNPKVDYLYTAFFIKRK